jgi:hypothetical protein
MSGQVLFRAHYVISHIRKLKHYTLRLVVFHIIFTLIMLDRFLIFVKEVKEKLDFIIIIAKKEDTNGL